MSCWHMWCLLLCMSILQFSEATGRAEDKLKPVYHDKECVGPQALGMENRRIPDASIWASSSESTRIPQMARVGDNAGAWTASAANANQYIGVDLGERMMVTAVETQGRKDSQEFVTEYYLQFSDDKDTWRYYTNMFGMPKMFTGNEDGNTTQKNTLPYPVVVRYIRINPQRWNTSISMRLEFHGCQYAADPVTFGDSYIILKLKPGHNQSNHQNNSHTIRTTTDSLKLRFRTDQPDGILFYVVGNQRDYFALELKRGYLYLHLNRGSFQNSPRKTTMIGGGLLDDYQWHDVIVDRKRHNILIVVDRLETRMESNGDFFRLDLDKRVSLGGVPSSTFNTDGVSVCGVSVCLNFHGCMENVVFDDIKIIEEAREGLARYQTTGHITYDCRLAQITSLTFNKNDSYILAWVPDNYNLRVSMEFRTHNTNGVLFYHKLRHDFGDLKVMLNDDGHVWYKIRVDNQSIEDVVRNIDMESLRDVFNDGLWHRFTLTIDRGEINCTVDSNSVITSRSLDVTPGEDYWIGGFDTENSFLGCMRDIDVGNHPVNLTSIPSGNQRNIVLGACNIRDRCIPNPCENNGACTQDWTSFTCHCNTSGYTGAVCHIDKFDNVVTFRKRDAIIKLPTFDAKASGDIWFQFKTTQRDGIILHNTGGDGYIQVGIYNGSTIQFSFNAGSGAYSLKYMTQSGLNMLNDNEWHTVHLERNRKQAWLRVDTDTPVERNEEGEQGYRILNLTSPLAVGATVDSRDGFVGCIRGMMVNGILMDLRGMVEREGVVYGVSPACIGKCDSSPCFHGGICQEEYNGYTCDCSQTPFRGRVCGREVGVNMRNNYTIRYTFDKDWGLAAADGEFIRIGFATKFKHGILLQITDASSSEYIAVEMNNNGGVKLALDVGIGRDELNTPAQGIDYANGQHHEVIIRRTNRGRRFSIQVDDYQLGIVNWEYLPSSSDTILDNPKFLYIGRNSSLAPGLGFQGCLYRMQFDNFFPLKKAFQDPRPNYIAMSPEGMRENTCGFEEVTQPPDPDTVVNVTQPAPCDNNTSQDNETISIQVGVNMLKNYKITYTFDKDRCLAAAGGEFIRIGFATKFKQGILLQITDASNSEYISVEMNNNGGVRVVLDVGLGRDEVNTPPQGIDYANGQQHEVIISRQNRGRRLFVQVDDYQPGIGNWEYLPSSADTILYNPKFLYIGRNSSLAPGLGFEGCLYSMQFDSIFPLTKAFQDPRPSYISLEPEGMRENTCSFAEVTQPPDPDTVVNVTQPAPCDNNTSQDNETMSIPIMGETVMQKEAVIIGASVGAGVLVLLLLVPVIFVSLRRRKRHRYYEFGKSTLNDNHCDISMDPVAEKT